MANSDLRPDEVVDDLCRMLAVGQERGEHVVRAAALPARPPGAACTTSSRPPASKGGTRFYTSGIDPGFGNAGITVHALALCKEVRDGPHDGDRQLRDLGQPLHDVRDHGLREARLVAVAAAGARARRRWRGDRSSSWSPRRIDVAARRHHRVARGASLADEDVRDRVGARSPTGTHLGHALRDPRHGRRPRRASSSSTSPACATATRPTGRRAAATASTIEGEPNVQLELELSSRPRRPQPRRLPGHRHARDQRDPARGGRRPRRAHATSTSPSTARPASSPPDAPHPPVLRADTVAGRRYPHAERAASGARHADGVGHRDGAVVDDAPAERHERRHEPVDALVAERLDRRRRQALGGRFDRAAQLAPGRGEAPVAVEQAPLTQRRLGALPRLVAPPAVRLDARARHRPRRPPG